MTNKWAGRVGFEYQEYNETKRRYVTQTTERHLRGDIINVFNVQQAYQTDSVNRNPKINNKISIVMDAFANKHFQSVRYVEFMGTLFEVSNFSVETPRLVVTMGGVYKDAKSDRA